MYLWHSHRIRCNNAFLSVQYDYDETNSGGTHYAEYTYLGLGQVVQIDSPEPDLLFNLAHGAGNDPHDGLDSFGRVFDLLWTDYGETEDAVRIKHGYDRASNRLWREDSVASTKGEDLDEFYTYDGMYRLTDLDRGQLNAIDPTSGITSSQNFAEQRALDSTGNWTAFKQDDDGTNWDVLDQARTHHEANEIDTIDASGAPVDHDAAGNMVKMP
jgi:hypothetical protein